MRELQQEFSDGVIAAIADEDPCAAAKYILEQIERVSQDHDAGAKQKLNEKYKAVYRDLRPSVKREIDRMLFRSQVEWKLQPNELYCLSVLVASLPAAVAGGEPLIKPTEDPAVFKVDTERLMAYVAAAS